MRLRLAGWRKGQEIKQRPDPSSHQNPRLLTIKKGSSSGERVGAGSERLRLEARD